MDSIQDVSALFDDDVNIVALRGRVDPRVLEEARLVLPRPGLRRMLPIPQGAAGLAELNSQFEGAPLLAEEIHAWADVLCELTGCGLVGVRVAWLESPMCPRFHVDHVTVRVVHTLEGRGTEYLTHEDADRRHLGHGAAGGRDERSGVFRTGARVRGTRPGDVVFLKGEAWPGNAGRGAVHRSPAASSRQPRFVTTLDPLG